MLKDENTDNNTLINSIRAVQDETAFQSVQDALEGYVIEDSESKGWRLRVALPLLNTTKFVPALYSYGVPWYAFGLFGFVLFVFDLFFGRGKGGIHYNIRLGLWSRVGSQ